MAEFSCLYSAVIHLSQQLPHYEVQATVDCVSSSRSNLHFPVFNTRYNVPTIPRIQTLFSYRVQPGSLIN